tara:strand:+ start:95 stop:1501 length:1407 start_codon:yes stop_codon:yes gene_type:complete
MVANLTTLNAALKEFYVSPITTQLNEEIDILNEFSKQSVSWSGSQAIFPIKTTRNTGVGYIDDGGNLPTAGNVGTERMVVTAMSLVSRFQITNKSLKSAKKGGAGAFIGALELEMDGAKEAAKNRANRMTTSGGHVVGFITAKLNPLGNAAANVAVPFFGDINKLRAVALAVEATGQTLRVQVICNAPDLTGTGAGMAVGNLSSYNPIGAVANDTCTLTSANVNIAAGTIALGQLISGGGTDIDTDAVPVGFGMAIKVNPTQATTGAGSATEAVANICGLEPEGLYGNIADETIHGLNRGNTGGTASTQTLQSHVLDMGAVAGAQTAISLDRIQQTFDRVMNTAGEEPDQIWISPLFRNQYTTLFSGAQEILSDANSSKKRADGGFSNISYAGIPMKTSRHVDNGMLIFIKRKHWKVAELSPIGFADEDGRIINKVQGSARIEGFLEWDYNLVCVRPNANAILTGLAR